MANYWLAKQEPSGPRGYNFEQLKKDKTTVWDGVHNNLALKHMREMKSGDLILFYHTGVERQAVGIMQVTSKPYSNPKEDVERFIVVDVKYKKTLKRPVTLTEIKNNKKFKDWELVRISRLSVMPVPKLIWDEIIKISQDQSNRFIDIVELSNCSIATAYVLINCELGSEEAIIGQLKGLEGVKEVHGTFGAYDILAKIESDTVEKLRETITWKIRKIEKIRSTLTLMGIEGQT